MSIVENLEGTEVAIIGMTGRFPGARNIQEFWQNLCAGVESIRPLDDETLRAAGVGEAMMRDPNFVKVAAALDDIELFDAPFFGFNPREAELMDPQQRIFLECAWEALENAGYNPETYSGAIGVFAGATTNTYLLYNLVSNYQLLRTLDQVQIDVSNGADFLATRVAYKLNLKGPSYTVQSACSTSLVAVHIACQNLLNEECDIALAGGVSVHVKQSEGYLYRESSIVSRAGHCRAFDARADGTVFGNGVGVVVLKRLEDALADGDHVHAVIRGSATNNDGSLKVGYTAPGVEGQAAVISEALAAAGVRADTISYIESHGTGTQLGDPIEIRALTKAFRPDTQATNFCAVGSLKTNIGHLVAAAGVAGLIKATLALEHKLIPPSLHFEQPNPEIDFANSPFYVVTQLTEWQKDGAPRRAGVSSFGVGGTNAHVVLEEAPQPAASGASRSAQLLLLSAKTGTALDTATVNLAQHLKQHSHLNLADVAYTLQMGRQAFSQRRMLVGHDLAEAVEALEAGDAKRIFTDQAEIPDRPVVFMFSGQGAQYVNMAQELYETEPLFCQQVDLCARHLQPHLGLDLRQLLYPDESQEEKAIRQLNQTAITQPALFVIEYALARLWQSWGVHPQAMVGHSIGEYVAACLAGVFSLEDALSLVAARGRLMQELPSGAMLAVSLPEATVRSFLGPDLALATVNAPSNCVVSGPEKAVAALQDRLAEQEVVFRRLHTSHAFHSAMMDAILEPFTAYVSQIKLNPPQIPYLSNVTGDWITESQATDPAYWTQHLRQTVRFSDGVRVLMQDPSRVLLEIGPGNTLTKLAGLHFDKARPQLALASVRHPNEQTSDVAFLLTTLGKLWLAGVNVDWAGFYAQEQRHRLPLPTYPFERQRYWIEAQTQPLAAAATALYKKPDIADWFYVPVWKTSRPLKPFDPQALADDEASWLLFADAHGLGAALTERLRQASQKVIVVMAGEAYDRLEENLYVVNPRQRDDYLALLQALAQTPTRIVHLWSLTPDQDAPSNAGFFEECQALGFYSLLFLAQALGIQDSSEAIRIEVVTNQMHSVIETEAIRPEKATLLGACQVIPQEYPHIACRCLDVLLPGTRLADQLLAELGTAPTDSLVAYRGRQRWVLTFEPAPLRDDDAPLRQLRPNGVYLITGGLAGPGLALAKYLAETVQARLALVTEIEPVADAKASLVQELEVPGAQVLVLHADVTDEAQMQAAIAEATVRFGPLNGVIHAVGLTSADAFSAIRETGYAESHRHFEPKAYGLYALEKALGDSKLDFCLLNASISTVLGGLGYAAYSAADLFMDAFAHQRNRTARFPWISVDWDAWRLAGETEAIIDITSDLAQLALTPAEGGQVFQRILASSTTDRVVVSTADLQLRIAQGHARVETQRHPVQQQTFYARPELKSAYVAPRNEIEQQVAEAWQQVLGIEKVGIHDDFFELGGYSLMATQLQNQLYKIFKVEIPIRSLFENATVAGVAALIAQSLARAAESDTRPIAERLRVAFPTERPSLLEAYLREKVAYALDLTAGQLPEDGDLAAFDLKLVAADLMWHLKQDFDLQVYQHEIVGRPSVQALVRFVLAELDRMADLTKLATTKPLSAYTLKPYRQRQADRPPPLRPARKNKSMVFLHSSPRAGSTLLRIMLAGHSNLFCPPELNMLFFEDMPSWWQNIGFGQEFQWTAQGVQWAFAELLGLEADKSEAFLQDLIQRNESTHQVYGQLEELAGDRLLVDKTPTYSMDMETLQRAEALFDAPKYIYLVRHPYAVIESFLRIRLDKLFGPSLFEEADVDPYVVAETVWAICNRNLLQFFESIESERYHLIHYEEMVSDPAQVMTGLCRFLDIPFSEALLAPYDGRRERMIGGLGDPNILQHDGIDAKLGEVWRKIKLPRRLDKSTRQLAIKLGYELPESIETPATDSPLSSLLDHIDDQELLASLDELSDDQVYTMLSNILAEEESN